MHLFLPIFAEWFAWTCVVAFVPIVISWMLMVKREDTITYRTYFLKPAQQLINSLMFGNCIRILNHRHPDRMHGRLYRKQTPNMSCICPSSRGLKRSLEASSAAAQRALRQKSTDVSRQHKSPFLSHSDGAPNASAPRCQTAAVCVQTLTHCLLLSDRLTSQLCSWTRVRRSFARASQERMAPFIANR